MKKLKPFNENAEMTGRLLKTLLANINVDHFQGVLQAHGLTGADDIDPNGWYSHTLCMDIFKEIEKQPAMFDEVSLGMAVIKAADIGKSFECVEDALRSLPESIKANHRNTTDYVTVELNGGKHAVIEDHTVWPHNAMYGIFWQVVRTFCQDFIVRRVGIDIDPVTEDEYGIYEVIWE